MITDEFGGWQFDLKERAALTDILKDKFDSEKEKQKVLTAVPKIIDSKYAELADLNELLKSEENKEQLPRLKKIWDSKYAELADLTSLYKKYHSKSEDREVLTEILKIIHRMRVETFLIWLEYICYQMKIWQDLPSFQEVEGYAEPILNSIKKTTDFLRLLEKEKLAKGIPFGFPNFIGSDREKHLFAGGKVVSTLDNRHHNSNHVLNIIQTAKTAIPLLEELQSQFERQLREWKGEPVKPTADSHSFVFDIAKRYFEIFHIMPTTTKKGTFDKVVCIALKSVNLPFEYPERKVRAAVKKLKATIAT